MFFNFVQEMSQLFDYAVCIGDAVLPRLRELELFHLRHNVVVVYSNARVREVF